MSASVVGALASVAGVVVAVVIGVLTLRQGKRPRRVSTRRADRAARQILPPPIGRLPRRVRGRDGLIGLLAGLARSPDGKIHVLSGLGGSGKSTVALAVASRARQRRRAVWWVSAADPESMTMSLLGLARQLGAPDGEVQEARSGRVNPSDVLWPRLQAAHRWLLVLDNADDITALAVGGRSASDGSGWLRATNSGMVLVTSRTTKAWGPLTVEHRIGPLATDAGGEVLTDLAPGAGTSTDAQMLAGRLGGLPLALNLAGAYLRRPFQQERTFAGYRAALERRFPELMGRGPDDRASVTTTWELSLDDLASRGIVQARGLLRVVSCFAASVSIPPVLRDPVVLAPAFGGREAVADGLSALLEAGLIETQEPEHDGAQPPVTLHPLLAETIRYQAGVAITQSLVIAIDLILAATTGLDPDEPRDQEAWFLLLPHLQALVGRETSLPRLALAKLARASAAMSAALLWGGADAASLRLAQSALSRVSGLAYDSEEMLDLRFAQARSRLYLGQLAEAEAEFREVLESRRVILGSDHPYTLAAWNELAAALAEEGRLAEAETEFRGVLGAKSRVLGPEDPSTLATRHELASALGDAGKAAEAETELRQVLNSRLRALAEDDPRILSTWHEIATVLADQGRTDEAESIYRKVLASERRVLGPDHPDTLATQHEVARLRAVQGSLHEAEALHRELLKVRLRVNGPGHPDTFMTRHELAVVLANQGKHAEAERQLRELLENRRQVLGAKHPGTLATQHNLARAVELQGKRKEARDLYREVLAARTEILGSCHPDTIKTRQALERLQSRDP
jgi:tetratricopeptide (TPR) repeat protein